MHLNPRQIVALYARRMQIELSFRDLKSHRYGHGFEDSLTRKGKRIEALLLLHTMAAFASWLVGMACETAGIDQWLTPCRARRRLYSIMRLGREALVRRWSNAKLDELMEQIRKPSPALLDRWVRRHENVRKPQPSSPLLPAFAPLHFSQTLIVLDSNVPWYAPNFLAMTS